MSLMILSTDSADMHTSYWQWHETLLAWCYWKVEPELEPLLIDKIP